MNHASAALSHLSDALLEEFFKADYAQQKKRHRRQKWVAALAVAACLCLVVTGTALKLGRLYYHLFLASCGAYPGQIVDGDYYYFVPHRGVMRYTPGGGIERMVHTFWVDDWQVNEYGVYYDSGRSLYVFAHESGQRQLLYTASWTDTTHIAFSLRSEREVIVTCYNKHDQTFYQVILDGVSGEILLTTATLRYSDYKYEHSHYTVGQREIVLFPSIKDDDPYSDVYLILTENGVPLLPEGLLVSKYSAVWYGESLWFSTRQTDREEYGSVTYVILSPDGTTELVTLPDERYSGGDGEYLFYPIVDQGLVGCVEVATGQTWALTSDVPCDDLHDLVSDGKYLYTTAPWTDTQTVWRVIRDEGGAPTALQQVAEDIAGH